MNRTIFTMGLALVACATAALHLDEAKGAIIFADSFDRPDSHDIDAVTTGMTNNTGTVFGSSAVYTSPWVDPNTVGPGFGAPDGTANNGGGQQILSNELQKYNPGTANLFVNHNFVNAAILAAGGFSVSLDVNGVSQATSGQGAAIGIGMSLAEAQSGHDAFDGTTSPATTVSKYTNAFQDTTFTTGTVLSDFYIALRGDKTLAWGLGGTTPSVAAPTKVTVAGKTGTFMAKFSFSDFNAGSPVNYAVFYHGVQQGSGTFNWSGTNENYIGVDARDSTLVRMDNLNISTVPEPTTVSLFAAALGCLGLYRRRRFGRIIGCTSHE